MKLRTRLFGWLQNIGLLMATLLALVVVLEIGTRLFSDLPPPLGVRDPIVGKRYRRNYSRKAYVGEAGDEVFLRFNREGFRGPDLPYPRSPGTRRIAVLGDSFVAAVSVAEEDTAVRVLERRFEASHPEFDWEVQNFGVSGSSTGQELALYRAVVARYHPDLVICAYYMGNDFSDNSRYLSNNPRVYFDIDERGELVQLPASITRKKLSAWLNLHSRFYVWQKRAAKIAVKATQKNSMPIFSTVESEVLSGAWNLNERLIQVLAEEVEEDGARFVLALFPAGLQVYPDVWDDAAADSIEGPANLDREQAERRLAAIAESHGIPVITMTQEFRSATSGLGAADTESEKLLFSGGTGHFTVRGNRLAAALMHDYLTRDRGRAILESLPEPPVGRE